MILVPYYTVRSRYAERVITGTARSSKVLPTRRPMGAAVQGLCTARARAQVRPVESLSHNRTVVSGRTATGEG